MTLHPESWHIALTEPQSERHASEGLRNRGYITYYPIFPKTIRHFRNGRNKVRTVIRPIFPGYLFVSDPEIDPRKRTWRRLHECPGIRPIHSLLRHCGTADYAQLSDEIVALIRMREQELCNAKPTFAASHGFQIGEWVRIEKGAFIGFLAEIETLDADGRIGLLINIFGRESRFPKFPAEHLASAS